MRPRFAHFLPLLGLLLLCVPSPSTAAEKKPIVAVFTVESKGVALGAATLDRLSDYLAGSLTATGRYEVVPRDQLKKRLVAQKAASYRNCYERSCQIEIGKELAAQKTLATQVIKLGTKCAITGTLFDLKRAAAERAATARGGCSEDEIVTSLEKMVKRLGARKSFRVGGVLRKLGGLRGRVLPRKQKRVFAVDFRSTPRGANVFLDGRSVCVTNCRVNLPAGEHELLLERKNYLAHKQRIRLAGRQIFDVKLKLSPEGRGAMAQRFEFMTLEGLVGFLTDTNDGGLVGGGVMHTLTLKWQRLFWSILEIGGFGSDAGAGAFMVTRVGYPLYYGAHGQHQVRFGLGLGGGMALVESSDGDNDSGAFILSPTAEYRYQTDSWINLGVGARLFFPVGSFDTQPFALFLSLIVAFQSPGYAI